MSGRGLPTSERLNAFGQPIGPALPGWTARPLPPRLPVEGRHCRLEPLDPPRHAADLHAAFADAPDDRAWTYLFDGPFADEAAYRAFAERAAGSTDPLHFAVVDRRTARAVGTLALMRIEPAHGVIEIGHVMFSPRLQRTPLSTEAQFLILRRVFDELGYRRCEWKCDSLNAPSRRAAERLGFTFEGIFRQAIVTRGRSRDTAWYAIVDHDWPALRTAFEAWLAPSNVDADGRQRTSLSACRGATDPPHAPTP